MSPSKARGLNAAFWGSLAAGRGLAIPLATRASPQAMLLADCVGCIFAMLLLSYAGLILLPLITLAMRVGRLARGAGGCAEIAVARPMYAIVVNGEPQGAGPRGGGPVNATVGVPVRVPTGGAETCVAARPSPA